jgi:hypothetical protein
MDAGCLRTEKGDCAYEDAPAARKPAGARSVTALRRNVPDVVDVAGEIDSPPISTSIASSINRETVPAVAEVTAIPPHIRTLTPSQREIYDPKAFETLHRERRSARFQTKRRPEGSVEELFTSKRSSSADADDDDDIYRMEETEEDRAQREDEDWGVKIAAQRASLATLGNVRQQFSEREQELEGTLAGVQARKAKDLEKLDAVTKYVLDMENIDAQEQVVQENKEAVEGLQHEGVSVNFSEFQFLLAREVEQKRALIECRQRINILKDLIAIEENTAREAREKYLEAKQTARGLAKSQ